MTGPGRDGVVAVVPLRDGVSGKSRLATSLAPAARRRLVATLARHVVGVLTASAGVDRVVVVTADVPFTTQTLAGTDLAGSSGSVRQFDLPHRTRTAALIESLVQVVPQSTDRPGLNAALDVGREVARALGADRLLVTHADLPLLAPDDVAALLAAAPSPRSVVVATDRHESGTNLLLVPATAPFRFRFGPGSRAAHVAEAGRTGLPVAVVQRPGTAADLDTVDDWGELPPPIRSWLDDVTGDVTVDASGDGAA